MLVMATCDCPECSDIVITPAGRPDLCDKCRKAQCTADEPSPLLHVFDFYDADSDEWHITL